MERFLLRRLSLGRPRFSGPADHNGWALDWCPWQVGMDMNTTGRESEASRSSMRPPGGWRDYVALARPDHWVKHIFILPGLVLAWVLHPTEVTELVVPLVIGFASAAALSSANYCLNEWLDAERDAFHPSKSTRPAVAKEMSGRLVALEYVALAALGLVLAARLSGLFLGTGIVFLLSGIIYNVRPFRTKDRPFLDVVSESINSPIRLTMGWAIVDSTTLPPSSLLLGFWMAGAYLMALKRFAEYRHAGATGTLDQLVLYRKSFSAYSENTLLLSSFLYSQLAAFFLAVFLIKYRVEYLLSLPLFAALFTSYLRIALKGESKVQTPERLFRERTLVVLLALLVVALALLTWIDIPALERLYEPHYISLPED